MAKEKEVSFDINEFDKMLASVDVNNLPAVETDADGDVIIPAKVETPAKGAAPVKEIRQDASHAAESLADQLAKANAKNVEIERERDEARRLASQHEAEAAKARNEGQRWRSEAEGAKYQEIVGAIANWEQKSAALETELAEAWAAGDFAKGAKLQSQIATVASQRIRLEDGKLDMEQRADQQKRAAAEVPADPVERYLKVNNIGGRAAEWVRRHPEIASDAGKQRKVLAAHYAAVDLNGLTANTDAYFDSVDKAMGYSQAATVETPLSAAAAETTRRSPSVAAPVSRDSGRESSLVRREGNKIVLTKAQRDYVDEDGNLTYAEYAQSLLALEREGRIGPGVR